MPQISGTTKAFRRTVTMAAALLCVGISAHAGSKQAKAAPEPDDILHITAGGIAFPDTGETGRHWSNWSINLIDGSEAYGWTSEKSITFPHALNFELAGPGKISGFVLDTVFAPVVREDGSSSQLPEGSPVRRFEILGSIAGSDGPWFKIMQGEAEKNARARFDLAAPVRARWIRLIVDSNWTGSGQTRLSEFGTLGELEQQGAAAPTDVSGEYSHEYGPIVLQQEGNVIHGCFNKGYGRLEGLIFGRVMRLAYFEPASNAIGTATFVASGGKLYGFWYRDGDQMGSPWNAVKVHALKDATLTGCDKFLDLAGSREK
jgi:hypothetical protein